MSDKQDQILKNQIIIMNALAGIIDNINIDSRYRKCLHNDLRSAKHETGQLLEKNKNRYL